MILLKMCGKILVLFIVILTGECARPGIFFWKPRLSLDLAIPTTNAPGGAMGRMPTKDNLIDGTVVLVDGYAAGLTVISMAAGLSSSTAYPHLNLLAPYFYTNIYRWGLRYMSLLPHWLGGHGGNYVETHKAWRRRFYYMDEFMPDWLRNCIPFVKKEDWEKEYLEWKRFKKYSESAFGKHYRYPTKNFNFFRSMETEETAEINYQEVSSESAV